MMSKLGEGAIHELDKSRFREDTQKELQELEALQVSRFIIDPNNYWK